MSGRFGRIVAAFRLAVARLAALAGRRRSEARMDEELRLHVELETEKNIGAGMSPAEARRRALIAFGGLEWHKEILREGRGLPVVEDLVSDVRVALRGLRRTPAFALVAVTTLALGIGGITAVFGAVNAILLRPLPYRDADRLAVIYARHLERGWSGVNISYPDYRDWKQLDAFAGVEIFNWWSGTLSGEGGAERLDGAEVSPGLFPLLGVEPLLGRGFAPDEDVPGRNRVIVLGHGVWQRRFGADPSVVGRTVLVDGEPHTIVGVMPPSFRFPYSGEAWIPLTPVGDRYERRDNRFLAGAMARLAPGADFDRAGAEMLALSQRLADEHRDTNLGWDGEIVPAREDLFGSLRSALLVLFVAAGLLLLIVCGNLVNLLLARAAEQRREIALRTAIGAGRGRLVRQLLTESTVVVAAGAVVGLGIALWGTSALRGIFADRIPTFTEIRVDPALFGFALGLTALVAATVGVLPALQASRIDAPSDLKEAARSGGGRAATRLRRGLVSAQVGLAVLLLVGSTLLVRSMTALTSIDLGFEPEHVLSARFNLPESGYPEAAQRRAFLHELLEEITALPGVGPVGAAQGMPFSGWNVGYNYYLEGEPPPPPGENPSTHFQYVTPGFFDVLGVPIVRGRGLLPTDDERGPSVAVINESFVARHFTATDPIGKRVRFSPEGEWTTIVGVVADYRHYALREPMVPAVYLPYDSGWGPLGMTLALRSSGPPADMIPALRATLARLDASVPAYRVETLDEVIARQTWLARTARDLTTVFAVTAALLALVGLYGLISYGVVQQGRQLAVRLAVGATPAQIGRLVVLEGVALAAVGIPLGAAVGLAAGPLLADLLFAVQPSDPLVYVQVILVVAVAAAAASYLPARRAARIDPAKTLRND